MAGGDGLYAETGNPFDVARGCSLDRIAVPCSFAMERLNNGTAVFDTITTVTIRRNSGATESYSGRAGLPAGYGARFTGSAAGMAASAFHLHREDGFGAAVFNAVLWGRLAGGVQTDAGGSGGAALFFAPQNPAPFPAVNQDDVKGAVEMAEDMLERKECDEALKDYGISSLMDLLVGLKFSGADANVFDGRTSSLVLPIGKNRSQQTVATYFKENKTSVGAAVFHDIHGKGDGDVMFLGHGFYHPEHSDWITQQQAIILLHEAVHQVGKKGDAVFKGSKVLSEKIIKGCYPALKGKLGGVG